MGSINNWRHLNIWVHTLTGPSFIRCLSIVAPLTQSILKRRMRLIHTRTSVNQKINVVGRC